MKCARRECIKQTDGESNYCGEHQFISTSTTRTIREDYSYGKDKIGSGGRDFDIHSNLPGNAAGGLGDRDGGKGET